MGSICFREKVPFLSIWDCLPGQISSENTKSKTYTVVPAEILFLILPLLLGVAFLVLAERKVMAFVQRRKGPDVVGSFGLLQPIADGVKLILKEPISPSSANVFLFRMAPVATFLLSLVAWAVVPFYYYMVLSDLNIGLLYLFAISSLGVYGIILAGWSSNKGAAVRSPMRLSCACLWG